MTSLSITSGEYDVATRLDLCLFIERAFLYLNPGAKFVSNWHIEMLAADLEAVWRGETRRLIVNQPPRSLKSICTSVAFVAWGLGHDPERKFIVASYGMELAEKLGRDCHKVMASAWYKRLFPGTRLSKARSASHDFETTAGGGRLAVSRGGPATGRGADLIIMDDPVKPDEALSDLIREQANGFVANTLLSRLDDKRCGAIVLVMQRVHENDVTGALLRTGLWRHVCLPAMAQADEEWRYTTPYGLRVVRRLEGEALEPVREPLDTLAQMRTAIGEYNFAAQYQQTPAPAGGGLIKREWIIDYQPHERPERFDRIVQSWDTANKTNEWNDYTVCITVGVYNNRFYLLHVMRERLGYPDLRERVLMLARFWDAEVVLIEDHASGSQLLQELPRLGFRKTRACKSVQDKAMRMSNQTGVMAAGALLIPAEASWRSVFLHELMMFDNGRYKDQVDALSQLLAYLTNLTGAEGPLRCITELAARLHQNLAEVIYVYDHPASNHYIDDRLFERAQDGYLHIPAAYAEGLSEADGWRRKR